MYRRKGIGIKMEKLLTIVIPAYNVERDLIHCLHSLLQPSRAEKTEILVVDDGSYDHTLELAEKYAVKYPQIVRVIHKENGGHGSAINTGIKYATGKYFRVVDGDDQVEETAYEAFLTALEMINCDCIATPYLCVKNGKCQLQKIQGASGLKPGKMYSFREVAKTLHIRMHQFTIRTSILKKHKIWLSEHSFYVDMQLILFPVPWIQTICILQFPVYQYFLGNAGQSVAMENMRKNRRQHSAVIDSLICFYQEREKQKEHKAVLAYLARGIAKMEANQIQIFLSMPIRKDVKQKLKMQEIKLKKQCPAAYCLNEKFSLWLLRITGYHSYFILAALYHKLKQ